MYSFVISNQTIPTPILSFLTALSSSAAKEKLLREVTTMSLLIHPNVMPLIGMCFDEEMPLLIMPFMSNGNVLEYVKQNEVDLCKDLEASEVEVYLPCYKCMYLVVPILLYFWTLH